MYSSKITHNGNDNVDAHREPLGCSRYHVTTLIEHFDVQSTIHNYDYSIYHDTTSRSTSNTGARAAPRGNEHDLLCRGGTRVLAVGSSTERRARPNPNTES